MKLWFTLSLSEKSKRSQLNADYCFVVAANGEIILSIIKVGQSNDAHCKMLFCKSCLMIK